MDEPEVIRLISQYLSEHDFQRTLQSLEKESGRYHKSTMDRKNGELQEILDDFATKRRFEEQSASSVTELFSVGDRQYANELWTSLDYLTEGNNVLVVRLADNGNLVVGGAKSMVVTTQITVPLDIAAPPQSVISRTHFLCKGGVLAVDYHPTDRNLLICSSMDRTSFIMSVDEELDDPLVQRFNDHLKYVTRALWSRTGEYFITGSYDNTIILYRRKNDESGLYEKVDKMEFKGTVEAMAISKTSDVLVIGVRKDYLLHCIDFSSGELQDTRQINLNALGDDYVSFTAMHCSFSPDEKFILVSTDQDRLILYSFSTGKLITNFYGASNDEFSQPRHCWDPSGLYIYGTSQEKCVCVWEVRSQKIVAKLKGHTGTVRDLYFCGELGLLLSCGFDGAVKLWRHNSSVVTADDTEVAQD